MRVEDCYQLGNIVKPHGLEGEIQAFLDVDMPETYQELESVFVLINQKLVPFFIDTISISSTKTLIKFEDVDSRESAEGIAGKELYLPLTALPELEDDQYYYHEIIGFEILEDSKPLGAVENIYNFPTQNLIVTTIQENEVLIPIQDDVVLKVDKNEKKVYVSLPEGLLEVYLNNDQSED